MKPTRSLSVIVPAYNEELRIGKMLEPTFAYLEQRGIPFVKVEVEEFRRLQREGSRLGTNQAARPHARRRHLRKVPGRPF